MICPVCGGKSTGKVGVDQYYCWDCFVEFRRQGNEIQVYDVAEDGSLMAWEEELAEPYL
ncbi:MAG: hypothetical protein ACOY3H_03510 [Bacillota bacterium]|uniref:hypothetical protein n=1 Tax=unclassified Carboxydocella TaxID=2685367 RepID=UPI0009C529F7|nr:MULTISPECIES: hypothetical protein [unclassified Carboxydocella]AVX30099.1 hypothetical protein CTH_0496 [Carboxydocella thermautotrophica]GAW29554.1 hypothetical protein ULO1_21240 [Carboxydocella sp. ULO1]GAW32860.1 hypothetical protein JDF658_26250 [Carboxydocella sp. JDF658]